MKRLQLHWRGKKWRWNGKKRHWKGTAAVSPRLHKGDCTPRQNTLTLNESRREACTEFRRTSAAEAATHFTTYVACLWGGSPEGTWMCARDARSNRRRSGRQCRADPTARILKASRRQQSSRIWTERWQLPQSTPSTEQSKWPPTWRQSKSKPWPTACARNCIPRQLHSATSPVDTHCQTKPTSCAGCYSQPCGRIWKAQAAPRQRRTTSTP